MSFCETHTGRIGLITTAVRLVIAHACHKSTWQSVARSFAISLHSSHQLIYLVFLWVAMAFESHDCSLCYFFMFLRSCFFFFAVDFMSLLSCISQSGNEGPRWRPTGVSGSGASFPDRRHPWCNRLLPVCNMNEIIMMELLMMLIIWVFVLVTTLWKLDQWCFCVCAHSHMEQTIYTSTPLISLTHSSSAKFGYCGHLFVCLFSAYWFLFCL